MRKFRHIKRFATAFLCACLVGGLLLLPAIALSDADGQSSQSPPDEPAEPASGPSVETAPPNPADDGPEAPPTDDKPEDINQPPLPGNQPTAGVDPAAADSLSDGGADASAANDPAGDGASGGDGTSAQKMSDTDAASAAEGGNGDAGASPLAASTELPGAPVDKPDGQGDPPLTADAFLALLQSTGGGTVTLNGDISLTSSTLVSASGSVTVEMGSHSIILTEGVTLNVGGAVRFKGNGDRPLFQLKAGSGLNGSSSEIVAAADGATAVSMTGAKLEGVRIEMSGANATAVKSAGNCTLTNVTISAKSGIGISNTGSLSLSRCTVTGAQSVAGTGAVTTDLSTLQPALASTTQPRRYALWLLPGSQSRASGHDIRMYGIPVAVGQSLSLPDTLEFFLVPVGGSAAERYVVEYPVTWSAAAVDTTGTGTYTVTATPQVPDTIRAQVERLNAADIQIHVYDTGAPHLLYADSASSGSAILYFTPPAESTHVRLLHTADDGQNWSDVTGKAYLNTKRGTATVPGLAKDRRHHFVLRITAADGSTGYSNILRYWYSDTGSETMWSGEVPLPRLTVAPSTTRTGSTSWRVSGSRTYWGSLDNNSTAATGTANVTVPNDSFTGAGQSVSLPVTELWDNIVPLSGDYNAIDEPVTGGAAPTRGREEYTFTGDGITVILTSNALDAIGLDDAALLTATLRMLDGNRFFLQFQVNGEDVADFGGISFEARVPYRTDASYDDIFCADADGHEIQAIGYEDGEIRFLLEKTGTYSIVEKVALAPVVLDMVMQVPHSASPTEPEQPAILPFAAIIGAAAIVGVGIHAITRLSKL